MLVRLRGRARCQHQSYSAIARQKRTECSGKRVLLLPDCGVVGWSCCGRVVHVALPIFNLLHGSMCARAFRSGILARSRSTEAERGSVRPSGSYTPPRISSRFCPFARRIHFRFVEIAYFGGGEWSAELAHAFLPFLLSNHCDSFYV